MDAINSVLAATDFSDEACNAVKRAAMIAAEQQARLELVHVLSEPALSAVKSLLSNSVDVEACLLADARDALHKQAADLALAHGLKTNDRVVVGAVTEQILAEGAGAGLVAMGGHGENPLRDLLLGSTAERLVGRLTSPVLVVKRVPDRPYRRVLLAVDLAQGAAAALRLAMQIAPQARITVLHAYTVPFEGKLSLAGVPSSDIDRYREEAANRTRGQLESLIRAEAGGRTGIQAVVARGDAPFVILKKQEELDADLVVMGRRKQSAVELFFLGSVSRHVLADTSCDVLVQPNQAEA